MAAQKLGFGPISFLAPPGWGPHPNTGPSILFSQACPGARVEVECGLTEAGSHLSESQVATGVILRQAGALANVQALPPYRIAVQNGLAAAAIARGDINGGPARISAVSFVAPQAWAAVIIGGPENELAWASLSEAGDGVAGTLELGGVRIGPQLPLFMPMLTAFPPPSVHGGRNLNVGGIILPLPSGWSQIPDNDPDWDMFSAPPSGGQGLATLVVGKVLKTGPVWQVADQVIRSIATYHQMNYFHPSQQGSVANLPAIRIAAQGPGMMGMGVAIDAGQNVVVVFIAASSEQRVAEIDRIVGQSVVASPTIVPTQGPLSTRGDFRADTGQNEDGCYRVAGVAVIPFKRITPRVDVSCVGKIHLLDLSQQASPGGRISIAIYPPQSIPGINASDRQLALMMSAMQTERLLARHSQLAPRGGPTSFSIPSGVASKRLFVSSNGMPPLEAGVAALAVGNCCVTVSWVAEAASTSAQALWLVEQIRVGPG